MKETNVSLAECVISRDPDDVLVAYGLGSCIGVVVIDPMSKACGLLHAVLPRPNGGMMPAEINPYKYVECGIESLFDYFQRVSTDLGRFTVRIIGGANMLMPSSSTQAFDIGTRNIEAARTTLARLKIPITTAEVGGHTGRTVRVYVGDARVTVRCIGEKEREL